MSRSAAMSQAIQSSSGRALARQAGRRPWRRSGAGRHTAPVNNLSLKSQHYNAKLLKGVPDGQNPLGPVNRMRYFMQCFLRAHPGSNRDDMRGCGYESARGQA